MAVAADPMMLSPDRKKLQVAFTGSAICKDHRIVPAPVAPSRRLKTRAAACAVPIVAIAPETEVATCLPPAAPAALLIVACVAAAGTLLTAQSAGRVAISAPLPAVPPTARFAAD